MEVVVKRISEGRIPWDRPSHSLLEWDYLPEWSPRNERESGIARVESIKVATRDFVRPPRTARARIIQWLTFLPSPHEMINDELEASGEEVEQRFGIVGAVKDVFFLNVDHRQLPSRGIKPVTSPREFFFLIEQNDPCLEPFLT